MPLLPYDYLHLVNCPEVVIISDILCTDGSTLNKPAQPHSIMDSNVTECFFQSDDPLTNNITESLNLTHEVLCVLGPVLCILGPLLWLTVILLPGLRLWCATVCTWVTILDSATSAAPSSPAPAGSPSG